jgi:hypothetical protein
MSLDNWPFRNVVASGPSTGKYGERGQIADHRRVESGGERSGIVLDAEALARGMGIAQR